MSWQEKLEQGYLYQAYEGYLATGENERSILSAFDDLQVMRNALRAKYWQKAFNTIEGRLESPDIVAWDKVEQDIISLQEVDKALEKLEIDEAMRHSEEVQLELFNAEKATLLGRAYILNNEVEEAKKSFDKALEYDPKHYRALTNLGNIALEANEHDEAISHYEKALTIAPDFTNALHNLGVVYRRQGKFTKSVRYLRRAQTAMRRADKEEARGKLSSRQLGQQLLRFQRFFWIVVAVIIIYYIFFRR